MSLVVEKAEPVPLVADSDGVSRVRGARVTLDTVDGAVVLSRSGVKRADTATGGGCGVWRNPG